MFGPDAIRISSQFDFIDNWGDPELVCADLVLILTEMAEEYSGKIHISPLPGAVLNYKFMNHQFEGWHTPTNDRNLYAMAADIIPIGSFIEAYILALKYFSSIGFYPNYKININGNSTIGALHVDLRKKEFFCDSHFLWMKNKDNYSEVKSYKIKHIMSIMEQMDYSRLV